MHHKLGCRDDWEVIYVQAKNVDDYSQAICFYPDIYQCSARAYRAVHE